MNATIRIATVAALVLMCSACNRRGSHLQAVSTPSPPNALSGQTPVVFSVGFLPGAAIGQSTLAGKVFLIGAAPAGGLAVSLSSGDPTFLSVPSTITVPAGADRVDFQATAQAVSADRTATITAASAVGQPTTTTAWLWTLLPTFFSFWSQTGDPMGGGGVRRLTPPFDTLSASCTDNHVRVYFSAGGKYWGASFQALKGVPLRVGTYEGATAYALQDNSAPGMCISGEGTGCANSVGRFVVREAVFTPTGQVLQFWASFEQHAWTNGPAMYGDVRVTNGPLPSSSGNCLQ